MSGDQMSDRLSGRVESGGGKYLAVGHKGGGSNNDSLSNQSFPMRVRPALAESVIGSLSGKERAIVDGVGRLRLLTGGQIQRLHFDASPSGQRHARRVLNQLAERRVLARLGRSIGGVRAGSAGFVYVLDVIGQRLVDPASGSRRPWSPGTNFVAHAAMASECYVQLSEAAKRDKIELLEFQGEPSCWRSLVNRRGGHQTLKPDAFARIGLGEFEDRWFVECDRATEEPARIIRKCQAYLQYWQTGKEPVFPRVLWVASRADRAKRLARCLSELKEDERQIFSVCDLDDFVDLVLHGADAEAVNNKGGEK